MINTDLWAANPSIKNTNLLFGYLFLISFTSVLKYSSKYSFLVPPPLKKRKSSTPKGEIVALQVKFLRNFPFISKIAGYPIFAYP